MPTLDPEKMMAMSATEKLEAMVGFMCTSDNGLFDAAPPPAAAEYSDCKCCSKLIQTVVLRSNVSVSADHRNSTEGSPSPAHSSADGFGGDAIANAESNPEDFRELMLQINKIPCEGTNGEFVRNFKRQTQRLMLSKLVKRAGSPALFLTPEFQVGVQRAELVFRSRISEFRFVVGTGLPTAVRRRTTVYACQEYAQTLSAFRFALQFSGCLPLTGHRVHSYLLTSQQNSRIFIS